MKSVRAALLVVTTTAGNTICRACLAGPSETITDVGNDVPRSDINGPPGTPARASSLTELIMNGMPGRHRAIPKPYVVVSIARSKPPEGASGENWYTYVIEQGDNVIRGHRQGTCASVAEFVDHSVGLLNERRLGKPGRTHLRLNSSKKG